MQRVHSRKLTENEIIDCPCLTQKNQGLLLIVIKAITVKPRKPLKVLFT